MRSAIVVLCLVTTSTQAEQKDKPARRLESYLLLGHGAVLTAAIVARKFRRMGVPIAATMSAAAFALRSIRTYRELQAADNPTAKELKHLKYNLFFSLLATPLSFFGIMRGVRAVQGDGWKMLVPFATPQNSTTWRSRLIGTTFFGNFLLSRVIDWRAHENININPLTSYNYAIGTVYDIVGGVLGNIALNNSSTLLGRLQSAGILTATYSMVNIYVQEIQRLTKQHEFKTANLFFDNSWGLFVSTPRNLLTWLTFHKLATKATGVGSAVVVGALWHTLNMANKIERRVWYTNSKLSYLTKDNNFLQAVLDRSWDDFKIWQKKKG